MTFIRTPCQNYNLIQPPHAQAKATVTILEFRQLRELELRLDQPSSLENLPISSITSTELRKIIFRVSYMTNYTAFARSMKDWPPVDELLCQLVDQLHATRPNHTLEVELRLTGIYGDTEGYNFNVFLPKFREKGVVTIVDVAHGDRVLHFSTHNYSG